MTKAPSVNPFLTCIRQYIATLLAVVLVPFFQMDMYAQPPGGYAPLDAPQLNQLVAPIALYPDSLVAQILTASTYPQQVAEAENWMQQNGGMPPEQRAAAVNSMPWDPSVKALTEFPSVLDNVARNYNWTAQLGNAYYNQPGDVMNAVQAMRMQAQEAGTLRSTPQQRVYDNGGLIAIQPVNPGLLYVPYYNPWMVYGAPIPMYRGWVMATRAGPGHRFRLRRLARILRSLRLGIPCVGSELAGRGRGVQSRELFLSQHDRLQPWRFRRLQPRRV